MSKTMSLSDVSPAIWGLRGSIAFSLACVHACILQLCVQVHAIVVHIQLSTTIIIIIAGPTEMISRSDFGVLPKQPVAVLQIVVSQKTFVFATFVSSFRNAGRIVNGQSRCSVVTVSFDSTGSIKGFLKW